MFMGQKVSEREFKEKEQAFRARYEKLPLRIGVCKLDAGGYSVSIGGKKAFERSGMTKENLQACLLACYQAFSCGKLPKSRRGANGSDPNAANLRLI